VRNRGNGRIFDFQTNSGNVAESGSDEITEIFVGDVQNLGIVQRAIVIDLLDHKTVSERLDTELTQKSSFRGTDLFTDSDDLDIGGNFDGTLVNLGGDVKGLEEGGLGRIHTSTTSRDVDIVGGNETDTSGSTDLEFADDGADVREITLGEDTDVAQKVVEERQPVVVASAFTVEANATAEEGVLTHQDGGVGAESSTDVHELLGADVVGVDDESLGVGVKEFAQACVILLLFNETSGRRHLEFFVSSYVD